MKAEISITEIKTIVMVDTLPGFNVLKCGYILRNEDDEPVNENLEAVEWIRKHCF